MITSKDTNRVFFSDTINTQSDFFVSIKKALEKHSIVPEFLEDTADRWCRDYMPIQIDKDRFIQYTYEPDYLDERDFDEWAKQKWGGRRTTEEVISANCIRLGIKTERLDVVLDGGNVMRCGKYVLMTSKVFSENAWQPIKLINMLENAFGAEVIFLPWDKDELFGHIDCICRPVDDKTILMNDYNIYNHHLYDIIHKILDSYFDVHLMQFPRQSKEVNDMLWAYMNFLQTKNCILVPQLGYDTDVMALEQIRAHFPSYAADQIEGIHMRTVVKDGGALNCISWNVLL